MARVPKHLYDIADSLTHGVIRACGYLIYQRIEFLVDRFDPLVGLRRATHVGSLIEVVYRSYDPGFNTGLLAKALKGRLEERLRTARLQEQEAHFADLGWWNRLDKRKAHDELASNLDRLIGDEPTRCLHIGIELHVLLDILMRTKYEAEYVSVITPERIALSPLLRESIELFELILKEKKAA